MPVSRTFHLSLYLALGLACLSLGYAEVDLLPAAGLFAVGALVLLVIAYLIEGRWALSLPAANVLGFVIAGVLALWFASEYTKADSLMNTLPVPTNMLPYLGPMLMVVLAAKVFRQKTFADYWAFHGIALTMIGLAAAMAEDSIFMLLLIGFLIVWCWSLTLLYLNREAIPKRLEQIAETDLRIGDAEARAARGSRVPWLGRASRWALLALLLSLGLFLITPRSPGGNWSLGLLNKATLEVGYPSDDLVDLNMVGTLSINSEVAFEVLATTSTGARKQDLPPGQLWRGHSLTTYDEGTWRSDRLGSDSIPRLRERAVSLPGQTNQSLPDYGPDQYFLTFTRKPSAGMAAFLADPIYWEPGKPSPIISLSGSGRLWFHFEDGRFSPASQPSSRREWRYRQVTRPVREPALSPPMRLGLPDPRSAPRIRGDLLRGPTSGIRRWTDEVITELVERQRLPTSARQQEWQQAYPQDAEAIAKALSAYLRDSPGFSYSLTLTRADQSLDPIEDFLFNTRSGHCNRFASALVLILRSRGIPARLVLGFKGHELNSDGVYLVRQSHAHAWAEALIPRTTPDGELVWHWLTLDPTPPGSAEDEAANSWWANAQKQSDSFFKNFIVGYDADRRSETGSVLWERIVANWEAAKTALSNGDPTAIAWATLVGLVLVAGLTWWWWCRSQTENQAEKTQHAKRIAVAFQVRLLAILARQGFYPRASQTPREFAEFVSGELVRRANGQPQGVESVPVEVVRDYYRIHYGGQELTPAEHTHVSTRLDELERAFVEQTKDKG